MSTSSSKLGTLRRDDRLQEAARIYLKLGNLQQYCEILVELGQWEKALSVAPGVSLEYWKSLCDKYADQLTLEDKETCDAYCVASRNLPKLAEFYLQRSQFDDALLVAQLPMEDFKSEAIKGAAALPMIKPRPNEDLLSRISAMKADRYFHNGQPVLAACCHLACGDVQVFVLLSS